MSPSVGKLSRWEGYRRKRDTHVDVVRRSVVLSEGARIEKKKAKDYTGRVGHKYILRTSFKERKEDRAYHLVWIEELSHA